MEEKEGEGEERGGERGGGGGGGGTGGEVERGGEERRQGEREHYGDILSSSTEVVQWDIDDVCRWMKELGLGEHCEAFQEQTIVGTKLLGLRKSDLQVCLFCYTVVWRARPSLLLCTCVKRTGSNYVARSTN